MSRLANASFAISTLRAEQPATSDYSSEIKALRARLDQLEVQQKDSEKKRAEAERKLDEKITSEKLTAEAARNDQFIASEGFTPAKACSGSICPDHSSSSPTMVSVRADSREAIQ